MTKIKTAQAFGSIADDGELYGVAGIEIDTERDLYYGDIMVPVVIVYGLAEAGVHEAAALLEKSREVCEHERFDPHAIGPTFDYVTECNKLYSSKEPYTFCACGRKVVVK